MIMGGQGELKREGGPLVVATEQEYKKGSTVAEQYLHGTLGLENISYSLTPQWGETMGH